MCQCMQKGPAVGCANDKCKEAPRCDCLHSIHSHPMQDGSPPSVHSIPFRICPLSILPMEMHSAGRFPQEGQDHTCRCWAFKRSTDRHVTPRSVFSSRRAATLSPELVGLERPCRSRPMRLSWSVHDKQLTTLCPLPEERSECGKSCSLGSCKQWCISLMPSSHSSTHEKQQPSLRPANWLLELAVC